MKLDTEQSHKLLTNKIASALHDNIQFYDDKGHAANQDVLELVKEVVIDVLDSTQHKQPEPAQSPTITRRWLLGLIVFVVLSNVFSLVVTICKMRTES